MPRLNVKTRLTLLIMMVLIPLILVQLATMFTQYNQLMVLELEANYDFAQAVALIFNNHIQSISADLNRIGIAVVSFLEEDYGSVDRYLSIKLTEHSELGDIAWLNPKGTVLASAKDKAAWVNTKDSDYYQQILTGVELVLSDVFICPSCLEPVVVLAHAIINEDTLIGIVTATLNLEKLNHALPISRMGTTTSFGLADSQGVVVYREGYPQIVRKMIVAHPEGPIIQSLRTGKPVLMKKSQSSFTNSPLSTVVLPLPLAGWVAYAVTDYSEVTSKSLASIKFSLLAVGLTIIASSVLAVKLYRSIVNPITALHNFADEMAAGNLNARAQLQGNDELALTGRALDLMATRIRQLEASRRIFIQSSAHELRNPLAGIKGIIQLLRAQLAQGLPPGEGARMLAVAQEEVDRVTVILNQLLEAFKEQNRHMDPSEYNWAKMDLAQIVRKVTGVFQLSYSHRIELHVNNEPVLISGDPIKLETVLRNILHNAVKYSPENQEIQVVLGTIDSQAMISVADKGIGVSPEDLDNIFESLYRGARGIGTDPGGMGLGLYLSREIIHRHKGRIWAESQGQGSTFYIELPLAAK